MPTIKLVVIGSSGVGKTSLRGQYISGRFSTGYRATIGADFISKTLPHPTIPGETVVLQIWDTAGQERFSSLSNAFFRGADAALLMFDVNSQETLISLKKWWAEFKERAPLEEGDVEDYCCVVVGNKIDLKAEELCVTRAEAIAFLDELVPPSSPPPSPSPLPVEALPSATSSVPLSSAQNPRSEAIPVAQSSSSYSPKHSLTKSRTRSPLRFYDTATSTRTNLTIYHTPASSLFESYYSARASPETTPSSPTNSSPRRGRPRRPTAVSTGSASSGVTITPSMFAREQASYSSSELPDQEFRPRPTTTPERGPKLFFTSAKTGEGVAEVFEYIANRVVARWAHEEQANARLLHYREGSENTIHLGLRNANRKVPSSSSKLSNCCS